MAKKKIVIWVSMPDAKSRAQAMALASKASGVSSVGIIGDRNDQLEVIGEGIDVVCLVNILREKPCGFVKCLRKPRFCQADILLVEDVKEKKPEEKKKKPEEPKPCTCPAGTCRCAGGYCPVAPMLLCEPEPPVGCHIM
ncbi:unnamed protein product [Urochloa humidicola]